ncbi:MAG: stage V sporulation protein SpoVM [Oscillospiraceae bacterium]|nr:stage V sporulation protein SpoVM [Oscillospiraceae bacterium]
MEADRAVCFGAWSRHCNRRDFSGVLFDVFGCVPSYILRDRAAKKTIGGESMKIVVWKSPRALSGILRLLFGIKRED